MLATNILLVIVSGLLLVVTGFYTLAAWRMNKVVRRQADIANLQAYLNVSQAIHITANIPTKQRRIKEDSQLFRERFEANYDKILERIFQLDP